MMTPRRATPQRRSCLDRHLRDSFIELGLFAFGLWLVLFLAWFVAGMLLVLVLSALLGDFEHTGERVAPFLFGLLGLATAWLLWQTLRQGVIVRATGLVRKSFGERDSFIPWSDVAGIEANSVKDTLLELGDVNVPLRGRYAIQLTRHGVAEPIELLVVRGRAKADRDVECLNSLVGCPLQPKMADRECR